MSQQNAGTGSVITRPSRQSSVSSTAPRPISITIDSDTSTTPNATNSHSRSVSAVTREIRLPVFLREKKARLDRVPGGDGRRGAGGRPEGRRRQADDPLATVGPEVREQWKHHRRFASR